VSTPAEWKADPTRRHELRYWDGTNWTEHVSDGGTQSTDPVAVEDAGTSPVTSFAMNPSDQTVIWEGSKKTVAASASGGRLTTARYRVTQDAVHFEAGLLSTKAEMIPLWTVVDVDLAQSMTQKARNVGDVKLHLDQNSATRFGQAIVRLESVEDPRRVRDVVLQQANLIRRKVLAQQHELELQRRQAGATSVTVGNAEQSSASADRSAAVISALKELASLRDAGVLTEEEFEAEKAKILAS